MKLFDSLSFISTILPVHNTSSQKPPFQFKYKKESVVDKQSYISSKLQSQRHIPMLNKNLISSTRPQKPSKKVISEQVLARFEIEPAEGQGSNRKRLKKLCEVNESEEMLEEEDNEEVEDQFIAEEQEDYKQFDLKDDEDLKKQKEEEEKAKENKKLKGNQQLDKFIKKQTQSQKKQKKQEKQKQQQPSMSMQEIMRIKQEKMKQRKNSDDFFGSDIDDKSDEEIDEQQLLAKRMAAYEIYNGSKDDQQQLIKKAMELSYTASSKTNDPEDLHEKKIEVQFSLSSKKPTMKQQSKKSTKKVEQKPKRSGPLAGYVICITGDFEKFDKKELEEICEQLGAQCPKSMVLRCNLLLQGSYVANEFKRRTNQSVEQTEKTKKALQRGIQIIPHRRIDGFFQEKTGNTLDYYLKNKKCVPNPLAAMLFKPMQTETDKNKNIVEVKQAKSVDTIKNVTHEVLKTHVQEIMPVRQEAPLFPPKCEEKMEIERPKTSNRIIDNGMLWSDKHKPTKLQDVIDENNQIKSLREWLLCWQDIHIHGNTREVKEARGWNASGSINSFAALLSGDPGIGKTTTARLLAKQCGYAFIQYNASDVRNKSGIDIMETKSFNLGKRTSIQKSLVIMDEVDGMSSGDRGGIKAIIDMIKKTKVPIICICNDRSSDKIRSLAGHCLDIKFQKPNKAMVVRRLKDILCKEGGFGQDKALEMLVETFQSDMRQILCYLQLIFKTVSKKITMTTLNNRSQSSKDATVMINHNDAAKRLLNRSEFSRMKISDRTDCFFVDSDMVPLMVQENILTSTRKVKFSEKQFHSFVQGVKGFVIGDMLDRTIRKQQEWGLMPSYAFMSCVYAPEKISESLGFVQFPVWLGKFSSEKKMRRLSKEFKDSIFPKAIIGNWKSAKQSYVPLITCEIVELLKQEKIQQTVQLMEEYNITPAIISEHLASLYYSPSGQKGNPLQIIPTATKTKLTKLFNKRHEDSKLKQTNKAKSKVEHVKFDPLMEEVEESVEEEGEDDVQANEPKPKPKQNNKKK